MITDSEQGFGGRLRRLGKRSMDFFTRDPASAKSGIFKKWTETGIHKGAMNDVRWMFGLQKGHPVQEGVKRGLLGRAAGRLIGPAILGYEVYSGYKEGGAWGAIKAGGESLALTYVMGAALRAAWAPALMGVAGYLGAKTAYNIGRDPAAFTSLKGYVRNYTDKYRRGYAGVQMGTPALDPFGNNATMRQRSLNAIQDSRINGRGALGNEAGLISQPYFR